jgi:hypothetical protein
LFLSGDIKSTNLAEKTYILQKTQKLKNFVTFTFLLLHKEKLIPIIYFCSPWFGALAHILLFIFYCYRKIFAELHCQSMTNEGAQSLSIEILLRWIPNFGELVDYVEETLLDQTLYLEFYSNSK